MRRYLNMGSVVGLKLVYSRIRQYRTIQPTISTDKYCSVANHRVGPFGSLIGLLLLFMEGLNAEKKPKNILYIYISPGHTAGMPSGGRVNVRPLLPSLSLSLSLSAFLHRRGSVCDRF